MKYNNTIQTPSKYPYCKCWGPDSLPLLRCPRPPPSEPPLITTNAQTPELSPICDRTATALTDSLTDRRTRKWDMQIS